jgi:hypothetical protein
MGAHHIHQRQVSYQFNWHRSVQNALAFQTDSPPAASHLNVGNKGKEK